jgi:hypothetical protein
LLRRGVDTKVAGLVVVVIILLAALAAVLAFPQTKEQEATNTSTSTATTTTTITRILGSISTTTTTTVIRNTTTITSFGAQSIGLITAFNFTLGGPASSYSSIAVGGSKVYVSGPNVTAIDPNDNTIAVIPTHGGVSAIAADQENGMVYANNESCSSPCTQSLLVINGTENRIVGTINLGQGIGAVAVDYLTHMVYAVSQVPATLYVINGSTDSLVTKVTFPGNQFPNYAPGVAVNQFKDVIYVPVCELSLECAPTTLYEISGANDSIVAQVPIQNVGFGGPDAIAVDSENNMVYLTEINTLISINGSSGVETQNAVSALDLGCSGLAIGFDDDIYLACSPAPGIPSFIVMDGSGRIIDSFTQSGSPSAVAVYSGIPTSAVFVLNKNGYLLEILRTVQYLP